MDYDFTAKQIEYRRALWAAVDGFVAKPAALRRIVYLDTGQALETKYLLRLGYSPENLLAVNRNPAEVATLTRTLRREGLPCVHVAGREFERYGFGPRDVVCFDGTSNICGPVGDVLLTNAVLESTPHVLAATVLCGRESRELAGVLRERAEHGAPRTSRNTPVRAGHFERVRWLLLNATGTCREKIEDGTCVAHVLDFRWNVYMSASGQPMAWVVAKLAMHRFGEPRIEVSALHRRVLRASIYPACWYGARPYDFRMPMWTAEQAVRMGLAGGAV